MTVTTAEYLNDLLDQLQLVQEFTAEGREMLLNDVKTQYAVARAYEIIGEILKRIPNSMLDKYPSADWGQVKRFRDFLAHNYRIVLPIRLWDAVEDIPNLRAAVESMLRDLEKESNKSDDPTAE